MMLSFTNTKRASIFVNDVGSVVPRNEVCNILSFESYLWNERNADFGMVEIKFTQYDNLN